MAALKEGDRVVIKKRDLSEEDRARGLFEHMLGLTGEIANVYADNTLAVMIDRDVLDKTSSAVHAEAERRMRDRFKEAISEEQYKMLSADEKKFQANYVHLVMDIDVEKI